ncbi:hypothetical protein [Paraburkholderia sediminicola]|uniref:hypothetical protein n=1 Tax=Paraburkholderia sediminicola TaxID=458836 RepID=UPI0038BAA1E5
MAVFATQIEGLKMRVSKFALALLAACFTLNASAEMTASQYKLWAHTDNNSVYAAYITGTINALGWANGDQASAAVLPAAEPGDRQSECLSAARSVFYQPSEHFGRLPGRASHSAHASGGVSLLIRKHQSDA